MDVGGVAGTEVVTCAEAGVDGCVSARRQRREEREKRLRGRGSSTALVAVGLKECTEGADRSEPGRSEAEPRLRDRFLLACVPPLEEASMRVSDDFDRGGLDILAATGR